VNTLHKGDDNDDDDNNKYSGSRYRPPVSLSLSLSRCLWLLHREIIAVCSEIQTKAQTLVEFSNVKPDGAQSMQFAVNG
jgi:hypothetical protein